MARLKRTMAGAALSMLGGLTLGVAPAHAAPAAPAPTAAHSSVVPAKDMPAEAKRAAAYWTPERMRKAEDVVAPAAFKAAPSRAAQAAAAQGPAGRVDPVKPNAAAERASRVGPVSAGTAAGIQLLAVSSGQPWTSGGFPASAIGRAFFTDDLGRGLSCTASSLRSDAGNALLTAGHCVINAANGHWYNWNYQTNTWGNWIFVPGYTNGSAPYGYWYANQLWTVPAYITTHGDGRYDIGAAVINTNASGYHLQQVVGSEGMEWNWPLSQNNWVFGYPGDGNPSFNGQRLIYCQGVTFTGPNGREQIYCNQGHGSSGGPWLDKFDGSFGWADSVVSTGTSFIDANGNFIVTTDIGPYFGNEAATLWSNVRYL